MNYRAQKYQRRKDPFTVQPLPKSFYHPSPTKEVDEREVIQNPIRKYPPLSQCALEEQFLRDSPTFKTSALPSIATLSGYNKVPREVRISQDEVYSSNQLTESWPDYEKSTSESASKNDSNMTSGTENMIINPHSSIADIVNGLEKLNYYNPVVTDRATTDLKNEVSTVKGESVLQRYIERFRNATPMSREERMKEKEKQMLDFWWLHSPRPGSADVTAEEENLRKVQHFSNDKAAVSGAEMGKELTKEALLAMDEETLKLQNKADTLLSRSELSLASSGPIVSTEGLGTSTSVSDYSVFEDQQPDFFRMQELCQRLVLKQEAEREQKSASEKLSKNYPTDDILSRWRLRRKMEEASSGHDRMPHQKSFRRTEMDSRLDEFRKNILRYRAPITPEDVQFERQKMAMMMGNIEQDCGPFSKGSQTTHYLSQPADTLKDPDRQHTMCYRDQSNTPSARDTLLPTLQTSRFSHYRPVDSNFNNATIGKGSTIVTDFESLLTAPMLNKNNTALSGQDGNENNNMEPEPCVDNFESQVVCDPEKKVFVLGNTGSGSRVNNSTLSEVSIDGSSAQNERNITKSEGSSHSSKCSTSKLVPEREFQKSHAEMSKTTQEIESLNRKIIAFNNTDIDNQSIHGATSCKPIKKSKMRDDKEQRNSSRQISMLKANENIYHQFLQAEKPVSEEGGAESKLARALKVNETVKHVIDKEKSEMEKAEQNKGYAIDQKRALAASASDRKMVKEQSMKKHKIQSKSGIETEGCDSDALIYITDESDLLLGKEQSIRKHKTQAQAGSETERYNIDALTDITHESNLLSEKSSKKHAKKPSNRLPSHKRDNYTYSDKSKPYEPSVEVDPLKQSDLGKGSVKERHQVHAAIGQTVTDHLFDGSTLMSSVDSWSSMFPQSPAPSHLLFETCITTPSPPPYQRQGTPLDVPLQSTPNAEGSGCSQEASSEEYQSDNEFEEDPLLMLLRQQRSQHLQKLEQIEEKLQKIDAQS